MTSTPILSELSGDMTDLKAPPASEEVAQAITDLGEDAEYIDGYDHFIGSQSRIINTMRTSASLLLRLSSENRALRAERDILQVTIDEYIRCDNPDNCPHPIKNDDGTSKMCIANGNCGCIYGSAKRLGEAENRIETDGKEIASLQSELTEARKALERAVKTIRIFHGLGIPKASEPAVWAAYQASPEMKQINAAISPINSPQTDKGP